ncbi:CaiB/BaiF CoA-transferase family protein [Roseovarius sp. SK2]|jgi:crotonobetainyl-CoA:carnitine CoA-transferase CaiB-like acyl-CoA transferase|uniref:CaiB/BaiF CoA transferase family protein n=1 Tax=Roseobacteraceae TaxID=2854170 RepID=UPI00237A68E6|nr:MULTISPECIES: CaiB/BaiF CoA-transferase family protein [Roseobacteraceae]MDD9728083.1 CaiB/BaiF CoA-transferase family protein [Roseovarius sp. SK2]WPZ31907.1 CaiB/BaiF CoA-transferase family protein [Sulfitobacter sp. OXR-159]
MNSPLEGLRVLDLSRILAGPSCAQTLGDLGADVIKIERPDKGDDIRGWGPPFLKDRDGNDTLESAYFMSTNRNKRSLTIDISSQEGLEIINDLIDKSDVLIENFKVGDLKRRGLDWDTVHARNPNLVYCSITGFGQSGPYATRPGYDFVVQGMGGLMSITGETEGMPMKVGVPISDIMAGMYATVSILAALRERDQTGSGRHIDISLLDCQVGWLYNQASNYLIGGTEPQRLGNAHPNIVPYETFATADGHINLAVGNDNQFERLCQAIERPDLVDNSRSATNTQRLVNRKAILIEIRSEFTKRSSTKWLADLQTAGIPCGPINTLAQVFDDPHIQARGIVQEVEHSAAPDVKAKIMRTPIRMEGHELDVRLPPPMLGEHTNEILSEMLEYDPTRIAKLRENGAI